VDNDLGTAEEEMNPAFARQVGDRLRNIRRQQGLSLQAVEALSEREFKASVLGAYERGERVISVLRMQRLAALYGAPVDQLLPRSNGASDASSIDLDSSLGDGVGEFAPLARELPLTIDLAKLESLDAPERELLSRYVGMIQVQRGDFNGRVLTIREEDIKALARVFERDTASLRRRLVELGLRAN
jgi:transcriptional regulator with XRE-family HTH domain